MYHNIFIYHSNDLHSNFKQWPYLTKLLKKQKRIHSLKQEDVLYFDLGDHADRFNPITEALEGKGSTALLNEVHVDGVTIGNNEGMTFSREQLNQLYEDRTFPVLLANLFKQDGSRPSWVEPYQYYTVADDLVIAVVGMTIPYYPFYDKLGWDIQDPVILLPNLIEEVRKKADVVILLSHLGLNIDEEIAGDFEGIDLIIGAHTHHLLKNGKNVKGTRIAQAGKFGHYLGQIKMVIDKQTKAIVEMELGTIEVSEKESSTSTLHLLEELEERSKEILIREVITIEQSLPVDWFSHSPGVQLLAEALREWCRTEISMVNSGVLLESLPKGVITKGDIHRICLHPINPCIVEVRGDRLKETIQHAFTEKMKNLPLKGYGFRGEVLGQMVFSGIDVRVKKLADGLDHVTDIYINEELIRANEVYRLATLDMFTFGKLYPALAESIEKEYLMPELLRDVLLWKLQSYR